MFDLESLRQKARRVAQRRWMTKNLRDISNNDNHAALERLYQKPDPWNLGSPLEQARFAATNKLIETEFGQVESLLEIGCGEGFQSTYLRRLCRNLCAVEVSATAVQRARMRLPDAEFHVGELGQQQWINDGRRFELAVACEVLYYVSNPRATVEIMNRVSDACLVTFFTPEAHKLTALVESMPNVKKGWFNYDGVTWLMAWWRNTHRAG